MTNYITLPRATLESIVVKLRSGMVPADVCAKELEREMEGAGSSDVRIAEMEAKVAELKTKFDEADRERMLAEGWGESILEKLKDVYKERDALQSRLQAAE